MMEIKAVIVTGELPFCCLGCQFQEVRQKGMTEQYECALIDNHWLDWVLMVWKRDDLCPLVAGKIIPTIREGYLLIKESEE
jgi:hypothetical protein